MKAQLFSLLVITTQALSLQTDLISNSTKKGYKFDTKKSLKYALSQWISYNNKARSTYGDIKDWDVSAITDFSSLIGAASHFCMGKGNTCDLSRWDVSQATTMEGMFHDAQQFNADLGEWDVSGVTSFKEMFWDSFSFKGRGIEKWVTSKATDMSSMFRGCANMQADLSKWDTSSVTDMWEMFSESNRMWDLDEIISLEVFDSDLSQWDVGAVKDKMFSNMFSGAKKLSQCNKNLISWFWGEPTSGNAAFRKASKSWGDSWVRPPFSAILSSGCKLSKKAAAVGKAALTAEKLNDLEKKLEVEVNKLKSSDKDLKDTTESMQKEIDALKVALHRKGDKEDKDSPPSKKPPAEKPPAKKPPAPPSPKSVCAAIGKPKKCKKSRNPRCKWRSGSCFERSSLLETVVGLKLRGGEEEEEEDR